MYFLIMLLQLVSSGILQNAVKHSAFFQKHEIHTFNLVFKNGLISPDGFPQIGILTNGEFPGPILRVPPGVFLRVKVRNLLPHGLVIHFHGIHQRGTVTSDGVAGITQYEIRPNGTYTYTMEVGYQSGTFMYHAHTGLDQNWAMGALIIEDPPEFRESSAHAYEYEETLILSQCWHTPVSEITSGILGNPFQDVPDTDSILINGRSYTNWSETSSGQMGVNPKTGGEKTGGEKTEGQKTENGGYIIITVKPGATYRFRVISLAVDSMLSWSVDNHTQMRVIEMDSILTQPVETTHLELNAAQRYSVLVTMDQPIGNYWIRAEMIPGPGPGNGRAILHYEGAPDPGSMKIEIFDPSDEEVDLTKWIVGQLYPAENVQQPIVYPVPTRVNKEFIIESHQVNINGRTQFTINGNIFKELHPPLLHQLRHGTNFKSLGQEQHLYEILTGESIQIVFVNVMSDDGECEQHPWHMHGHAFHVVGEGPDGYDPLKAKPIIEANIKANKNQFRDVVTLYPNEAQGHVQQKNATGTPCGWVAIRFVADNPGLWIVHCHLTAHMLMGKIFVLYEHSSDDPYFNEIS